MTTITDPADIQIVDLPAAFPNAEQATYAWAQHRGITDSPVLGYAVLQTDAHGLDPLTIIEKADGDVLFAPNDYASALTLRNEMISTERDLLIQFHESVARYAFRVVNVYAFGGKPTIVL